MTLTRKIVLRDAPPLVGTEIAVYIDGKATDKHDGFTFVIARIVIPVDTEHFTIEWGDGSSEIRYESVSDLAHTYARPGLYRIRLCDAISNVTVSASAGSDNNEIYAPMGQQPDHQHQEECPVSAERPAQNECAGTADPSAAGTQDTLLVEIPQAGKAMGIQRCIVNYQMVHHAKAQNERDDTSGLEFHILGTLM